MDVHFHGDVGFKWWVQTSCKWKWAHEIEKLWIVQVGHWFHHTMQFDSHHEKHVTLSHYVEGILEEKFFLICQSIEEWVQFLIGWFDSSGKIQFIMWLSPEIMKSFQQVAVIKTVVMCIQLDQPFQMGNISLSHASELFDKIFFNFWELVTSTKLCFHLQSWKNWVLNWN